MAKNKIKKLKKKNAPSPEIVVVRKAEAAVAVAGKPRAARKVVRTGANGDAPKRLNPDVTARMLVDLRIEAEQIEAFNLKMAAARKRRDALIVRIADRGVSETEVGRAAKLSGPRVNQIYHGTGNGSANNGGE